MKKASLGLLGTLLLTTACQSGIANRGMMVPNPGLIRAQSTTTTALPPVNNRVIIAYQGNLTPAKISEIEQQNGLQFQKDIPQIKVAIMRSLTRVFLIPGF